MNAYYFLWAALIAASLWASVGGFLLAHRHGQFRDQDRARFLALRGETCPADLAAGPGARREVFVMAAIISTGIFAILTVLVVAALRLRGGGL